MGRLFPRPLLCPYGWVSRLFTGSDGWVTRPFRCLSRVRRGSLQVPLIAASPSFLLPPFIGASSLFLLRSFRARAGSFRRLLAFFHASCRRLSIFLLPLRLFHCLSSVRHRLLFAVLTASQHCVCPYSACYCLPLPVAYSEPSKWKSPAVEPSPPSAGCL